MGSRDKNVKQLKKEKLDAHVKNPEYKKRIFHIWTLEEESRLRQSKEEGKSWDEIAEEFGMNKFKLQSIYCMKVKKPEEKVKYHRWTKEQESHLRQLKTDKKTWDEIA